VVIDELPRAQVVVPRTGRIVARQVALARPLGARLKGLMGRPRLSPLDGLWLEPGAGVHSAWMQFPIDVVFVAGDGAITGVRRALRPWRACRAPRATRATLELAAGTAASAALCPATRIALR
jgi:uncharacterized membrane protein (UPF0127 family)